MPDYLTTKEVANLLRIKERKVYDLAAKGGIPCSRAMGKLLFDRDSIEAWVAAGSPATMTATPTTPRPPVILGSHDPLLDWALRESGAGLATYCDGSFDGLDRFAAAEGVATGLHIRNGDDESSDATWNTALVQQRFSGSAVVLAEWAWRTRGLIVRPEDAGVIGGLSALQDRRVAHRQSSAGGQALFETMLTELNVTVDPTSSIARTETDAATAVSDGSVDAAFGLEAVCAQYRLAFVPLITERFDLLVDRRAWFEAPFQTFLKFCATAKFATHAARMAGYDVSGLGTIHFNG